MNLIKKNKFSTYFLCGWLILHLPNIAFSQDTSIINPISDSIYESIENKRGNNNSIIENKGIKDTIGPQSHTYFDDDIIKKYDSDAFRYDESPQSDWTQRFKEWLSELLMSIFNFSDEKGVSKIVELIIKIFYLILILGAIWIIVRALKNKEGGWIFKSSDEKIKRENEVLAHEAINENLETLIHQSVKNKDYRDAVRYHYVWVLKNLNSNNVIKYTKEKTSQEFYYEIKNTDIKKYFKDAARVYNAVWYGNYEITENEYKLAEKLFKKLISKSE